VLDAIRTWATAQTFASAYTTVLEATVNSSGSFVGSGLMLNDGSGFRGELQTPGLTGDAFWILPSAGGSLVTANNTTTLGGKTLIGVGGIRCGTSTGTNIKFQNGTSTTQFVMWDLVNLTAQRNIVVSDMAGTMMMETNMVAYNDDPVYYDDD